MLHEGVEAALIVLIVASFLRKGGRSATYWVLIGLGLVGLLWLEYLEYSGVTGNDGTSWRQALSHLLDTLARLPSKFGL
jgi:hypothetical protein